MTKEDVVLLGTVDVGCCICDDLLVQHCLRVASEPSGVVLRRKGSDLKIYKGKAFPSEAWSGPEGSRQLRFPDFMTTAQDGGKVVSLTQRPTLAPGNAPGTHFR